MPNVPDYSRFNRFIGQTGLTNDLNILSAQVAHLTAFVNSLTGETPPLPVPPAPSWSLNTQTRILSLAGPSGYTSAALEYSVSNGPYQSYTAGLSIDATAHTAGKWQGRVKASSTNQAGTPAGSPTISAAGVPLPPHTLTGPSEGDLNGVTLTTDGGSYVLYYTRLGSVANADGKRMDLVLAGEVCAAVDFPASHLTTNTAWAFTRNGQTFTGNFTDGTVTLA